MLLQDKAVNWLHLRIREGNLWYLSAEDQVPPFRISDFVKQGGLKGQVLEFLGGGVC